MDFPVIELKDDDKVYLRLTADSVDCKGPYQCFSLDNFEDWLCAMLHEVRGRLNKTKYKQVKV